MANARQFMASRTAAWAKAGNDVKYVEWLECTGNQYIIPPIDIGGCVITARARMSANPSGSTIYSGHYVFGRVDIIYGIIDFFASNDSYNIRWRFRGSSLVSGDVGDIFDWCVGKSNILPRYGIDRIAVFGKLDAGNGSVVATPHFLQISDFQISKDGVVIADCVAVVNDGVACFMNKVDGSFYYSETGDNGFIVGPDKT